MTASSRRRMRSKRPVRDLFCLSRRQGKRTARGPKPLYGMKEEIWERERKMGKKGGVRGLAKIFIAVWPLARPTARQQEEIFFFSLSRAKPDWSLVAKNLVGASPDMDTTARHNPLSLIGHHLPFRRIVGGETDGYWESDTVSAEKPARSGRSTERKVWKKEFYFFLAGLSFLDPSGYAVWREAHNCCSVRIPDTIGRIHMVVSTTLLSNTRRCCELRSPLPGQSHPISLACVGDRLTVMKVMCWAQSLLHPCLSLDPP